MTTLSCRIQLHVDVSIYRQANQVLLSTDLGVGVYADDHETAENPPGILGKVTGKVS